ncbi:MAG: DNA repair protein RecO [Candidatus Melainabacteria bacterium]|nr:DNA repair protein RecO [Candidatus Melainabacteria bacterium]
MPTFNDYGIVLSSYNLAEADKILNIYTKHNGLVRAIAKGKRKLNNKLGGKIDQLSCCFFQFAKGKSLDIICECEQINSFLLLRSDLTRLTYGVLSLEVVSNFAHEQESESIQTYDLLYDYLDKLQKISDVDLFSINFIVQFLSIHGYRPQFKTCVSCSKEVTRLQGYKVTRFPYSSALGGLLCDECANFIEHKLVRANALGILLSAISYQLSADSYQLSAFSKEDIHAALDLLREHLDARAKNKIKSFDLALSLQ